MRSLRIILLILALCPLRVGAEELTAEKMAAIRDLIATTGGENMALMMVDFLVQSELEALSAVDSNLTPEIREIVKAEVSTLLQEELSDSGGFWEVMYPIYNKYFTLEEIVQIREFYDSEVGQKTIAVMPMMMQESLAAGKEWGMSLGPELSRRMVERLERDST